MSEVREVPLSQGKVAIVDAADFAWLSQWKWTATNVARPDAPDKFYACRMERKDECDGRKPKMILMHRQILGIDDKRKIDHRDLDTLNNRRGNLRPCTQGQNCLNHRGHRDRRSRFKGVYWHAGARKWMASFRGKYLGLFTNDEQAAVAYDHAAQAYSPEFALLNCDMGG